MNPFNACLLFLWVCLAMPALAQESRTLTITTWGGAYEASQRAAYFDPFERTANVEIRLREYNGGTEPLRRSPTSDEPGWDVLDMTEPDALAACAQGLLEPFNAKSLLAAPDGTPAAADFLDGAFLDCGVIHLVYSTVLAYDDRAFPGEKPLTVSDFFDVERFPENARYAVSPSPCWNGRCCHTGCRFPSSTIC